MKVKYRGGLIRYEVNYKGVSHIFSEANNYILDFDDEFAKNLIKYAPNNFVAYNEKNEVKENGMQDKTEEETEKDTKKVKK
ncbi:MAG: hypothetical protein QXG00_06705 [Candidatus Woesearchaeota archaeon]